MDYTRTLFLLLLLLMAPLALGCSLLAGTCTGRVVCTPTSTCAVVCVGGRSFTPRACPHSTARQHSSRGLMQKEAARQGASRPPVPPAREHAAKRAWTGPFPDLQFQPSVVHQSPCATAPAACIYYKLQYIQICLLLLRAHRNRATLVSRDSRAYATVRHGTGAVRYGTLRYGSSRVESSRGEVEASPAGCPASTRAGFNIPSSIGIDPVPHAVS